MLGRIAILGAAGDLAARYLLPALAEIVDAGSLEVDLTVIGVARQDWDRDRFQAYAAESLEKHASATSPESRARLVENLEYQRADVMNPNELRNALSPEDGPLLVYLALPPSVFGGTIDALEASRLSPGSRIVVEKPFGEDLESAVTLNRRIHEVFPEEAVFRIDHFLGKQTVQNILGLRFANRIFEPIWNCHHIQQVEIIWDEMLALEGRAGYYDSAGALKDMIQNHLLQLLCLVAMEPPISLDEHELRDRKIDLLRSVRRMSPDEVARGSWRARYTAGVIDGRKLPNYVDEDGVDPARGTETFAAVRLLVDNWRWGSVPFVLRSGKALAENRREINIYFQDVPHLAFGQENDPRANVLRMEIDPDRIHLDLNVNCPGDLFELRPVDLALQLAPPDLPAYGTLLLDVLRGDPMLFIRDDEAEQSWRIVEPILEAWEKERVPLNEYPAGTDLDTGMLLR